MVGPVEIIPGEFVFFVPQGGTPEMQGAFGSPEGRMAKDAACCPNGHPRISPQGLSLRSQGHPVAWMNDKCPIAMAGPKGGLLWCDS